MADLFFASGNFANAASVAASAEAPRSRIPDTFVEEVADEEAAPPPRAVTVAAAAAAVTSLAVAPPALRIVKRERVEEADEEDDEMEDEDDDEVVDDDEGSSSPRPAGTSGKRHFVDITEYLCLPQSDAATKLGLPVSTLSKRWKEAARNRKWPFRKVAKIDKEISAVLRGVPQGTGTLPPEVEDQLGELLRQRQGFGGGGEFVCVVCTHAFLVITQPSSSLL